jgi:hypothetical protein
MKYLIEFKIREPLKENWDRVMEINNERESAGKGFVANNRLIGRWFSVAEGLKVIQIVEIEEPSILAEWIEAYRNAIKFKIEPIMTGEEYGLGTN